MPNHEQHYHKPGTYSPIHIEISSRTEWFLWQDFQFILLKIEYINFMFFLINFWCKLKCILWNQASRCITDHSPEGFKVKVEETLVLMTLDFSRTANNGRLPMHNQRWCNSYSWSYFFIINQLLDYSFTLHFVETEPRLSASPLKEAAWISKLLMGENFTNSKQN